MKRGDSVRTAVATESKAAKLNMNQCGGTMSFRGISLFVRIAELALNVWERMGHTVDFEGENMDPCPRTACQPTLWGLL